MTGRPVFQSQFERRCWRRLNGGGPLGSFSATNGGTKTVLEEIRARDGTACSALLVSLIGHLGPEADPQVLRDIVSRSRARDCLPSVAAADAMLSRGDTAAAKDLLSMSAQSGEVLNRSLAEARILQREGDMGGAREAAVRAYGADPDCGEAYEILEKVDPDGGWPQRRNIQDLLSGRRPEGDAGDGGVQRLYQIYYEWFRGNRERASDLLVRSQEYVSGDPEYLLASARMSVDEKDWHSARMMFDKIPGDAPPFVRCEAAEAALAGGDATRALALFAAADQSSPRVMLGTVRARALAGETAEMMDALRSYLDSEFAGSEEWKDAVGMLLDMGMEAEATSLLSRFMESSRGDPDALTMRSVVLMRAGDLPAALMSAEQAVLGDRDGAAARVQRAEVLFRMGSAQRAEKECAAVLRRAPDDAGALSLMIDILMSRGEYGKAEAECRRRLDADPEDVSAMLRLAEAMVRTGDGDAADMCNRAVRADGSDGTYVKAVSLLLTGGVPREAEYLCREAEKRYPGDAIFRRLRGNAEYAQGEYLKASVSFAEAAGMDPEDPVLWHSKGMADEARGDLGSASDAYARALALDGDEPEYWISMAAVQEKGGDPRSAIESLNMAVRKGDRRYAMVRKAAILSSEGRHAEALGLLDMVLAADPGDVGAIGERMRVQMDSGDPEGALATFARIPVGRADARAEALAEMCRSATGAAAEVEAPEEAPLLRGEPEEPGREEAPAPPEEPDAEPPDDAPAAPEVSPEEGEAQCAIAESLLAAGDFRGAMRAADRALAADPDDPRYIVVKARAAVGSGDPDGALFLVSPALSRNPDDAGLHMVTGEARAAKGDLGGALREFDAAVSLGLDDADVHAARGEVLERMGSTDRAAECYSAAVSRDPDRLELSEKLARMMLARREAMAADGMVNRVLKRDPRRVSAILLKAEIAQARADEAGIMRAYALFSDCPDPGSDATIRMVRILEDAGHQAEARELVAGPRQDSADAPVKRYAEKVLRRAYSTKVRPTDPDLMAALGLDPDTAAQVRAYVSEMADYGHIAPGTEGFAEMEARSREAVEKLGWRDLEGEPRLPLEAVFVQCGYRDCDDAKRLVSYVHKAMLMDLGRRDDPRLAEMSMRLPKGMTVYEIMRECGLGVYEARVVKSLII